MTPEAPEDRLARLRAAGADRFDPLGAGFIASLLSRAEALDGGARAKLRARAEARLDALDQALSAARARAEATLEELTRTGLPIDEALAEALTGGDFAAVERGARQRLHARSVDKRPVALPWLTRLCGAAAARALALPEQIALGELSLGGEEVIVERGARRRAQALGSAISIALFRDSAARARAALAVAHATDNVPEAAGPYNAQVLSARALSALAELSPGYIRALIAELDDLAGLKAALEAARKPKSKVPRQRRGGAATA